MNRKIFSIILLVGFVLFDLISISYAKPPLGQNYPYKTSATLCDGDDKIVSLTTDGLKVCAPSTYQKPKDQTGTAGTCGDPAAFTLTPIESQSRGVIYICLPTNAVVSTGGIKGVNCPDGTKIQTDASGNPIGCYDPSKTQNDCAPNDLVRNANTNAVIGCKVQATSLIGTSGQLILPDGSLIKQPIRPYIVSFPIPCRVLPGIGGECPSEAAGPAQYITRLYQFGLMIVGFAAFASIVYGAVKYILSAGGVTEQGEAKEQIRDAILGLILLLSAFLILYTINPALVDLRNPTLAPLNLKVLEEPGESEDLRQLTGSGEGAAAAGDLCALRINAQIDVNVSANTNANALPVNVQQANCTSGAGYIWNNGQCFIKPLINTSDTQLPAGTQRGTVCKYCKANAAGSEKGLGPLSYVENCQCNPGFENFNGECIENCKTGLIRNSSGGCEFPTKTVEKNIQFKTPAPGEGVLAPR